MKTRNSTIGNQSKESSPEYDSENISNKENASPYSRRLRRRDRKRVEKLSEETPVKSRRKGLRDLRHRQKVYESDSEDGDIEEWKERTRKTKNKKRTKTCITKTRFKSWKRTRNTSKSSSPVKEWLKTNEKKVLNSLTH